MDKSEYRNPWITKSQREVYENPWIKLTEYQVIHPGGKDGIYGVVHFKSIAAGIIPLDEHNNTWIVGQYRYTLGEYSWEIPEGGGSHTVDILESARRELEEETGITAKNWTEILRTDLSNSVTDERGVVFIARDLSFQTPNPDDDEELSLRKIPFAELFEMTMRGEITDGLAVSGILKAQHLMLRGEL